MRILDRFRRSPAAPRVAAPVIRVARPQPRTIEEFGAAEVGQFIHAIHQAEAIRRNARGPVARRQRIEIWVQVSEDDRHWQDWELFDTSDWRGAAEGGVRLPTFEEVIESGRKSGCRYVRGPIVRTCV